jgi:cytochrome c biogenesis protein CcmG, thiol:disulfide interchange protein DsbE
MRPQAGSRFRPTVLAAVLAVAAIAAVAATAAVAADPVPAPAGRPVLAAGDLKLADYAGKVVVLDFWASWCKPCKLSMPWLSALQRKYGPKGLQIVAVSVDTDEKAMRTRLAEIDDGIVVVFDPKGDLAGQYRLQGMPTTFLFGRDGKPAGSHLGYLEKDAPEREAEIAKLLEAKP